MGQALINRIAEDGGRVAAVVSKSSCLPEKRGWLDLNKSYRSRSRSSCSQTFLVVVFLVAFSFTSAYGLACVQCISLNDLGCSNGGGAPKACIGAHANSAYCLKSVGTAVSGKGHFVMRSCSDTPITNCTRKHEYGDMYTVCHYPCAESGCNTGSGLHLGLHFSRTMSSRWLSQPILLLLWSFATWTFSAVLFQRWEHPFNC